jgi:PAS domain S-box-containing protein
MKSEKKFWGLLLIVSALFIILLTLFLMNIIYPFHVEQMKSRARETLSHLRFVLPHLSPVTRQEYLEKISRNTEELSYLLLMDIHGNAVAHSNPIRVGMNFDEPGFRKCLATGERIEQIYFRDQDNPASPYHNEKTLDILEPYYSSKGKIEGAVNVGISMKIIEEARRNYIIVSIAGTFIWLLFISGFAMTHARTMAMKRRAEQALIESEEKYRFLVENSHDIAYIIDTNGVITFIGRQLKRYGINPDSVINSRIENVIHPDDVAEVWRIILESIKQEKAGDAVFRLRDTGSGEFWFESKGNVIRDQDGKMTGFSGIMRDITEKRELEEQLRQSQKMDVIGQLAGGIAHDFNNMLGGIIGSAELLSIKTEDNPSLKKYADIILKGAERASELTRNLLAYSRKAKFITRITDIHEPIKEAAALLERTIDRRITIKTELNASPSRVTGDPTLLQNAVMNLGINARDAMPDGGTICFRTENVILDEHYCSTHPGLLPGDYIEIEVSDTGAGIPEDIMHRIFEPFFTTKKFGQGTGLGLAAVYGTVKEHKGDINVYSEKGRGTVFKFFLPADSSTGEQSAVPAEIPVTGTGCILLVDDEAIIRNIAQAQLSHLGYEVLLAEDGESGIELFIRVKERISLVILDLVMPKISGQETLRRLLEIDPGVKVLVASGFNYHEGEQELSGIGAAGFIQKPFQLLKLSRVIAEVLKR